MFFGNASDLVPQAESGKVRLLGVATPQRMKQLPNVPTISETYPGMSLTKLERVPCPGQDAARHHQQAGKARHRGRAGSANAAQLTALGIEPIGTTPEEFAAQINREQPQFDAAIKAANLKPE